MREWWANVYPHVDAHEKTGGKFPNRSACEFFRVGHAKFRIHVRLKPEGAPKRYASEANRLAWERDPLEMLREKLRREAMEMEAEQVAKERAIWMAGL